jgi:hypothetical protein
MTDQPSYLKQAIDFARSRVPDRSLPDPDYEMTAGHDDVTEQLLRLIEGEDHCRDAVLAWAVTFLAMSRIHYAKEATKIGPESPEGIWSQRFPWLRLIHRITNAIDKIAEEAGIGKPKE